MGAAVTKELAIGVIVYEHVTTLDLVGPTSYIEGLPFVTDAPMAFHTISNVHGPMQPSDKVSLFATTHYAEAPRDLDVLIVPGAINISAVVDDPDFLAYIHWAAVDAPVVLTVGTGSQILGLTGVLDGRRATTSKRVIRHVAETLPDVQWDHSARWVIDGKWWTSAGVSAGLDMGRAFVAATYDEATATKVSRNLEHVVNTDPTGDPFAQ